MYASKVLSTIFFVVVPVGALVIRQRSRGGEGKRAKTTKEFKKQKQKQASLNQYKPFTISRKTIYWDHGLGILSFILGSGNIRKGLRKLKFTTQIFGSHILDQNVKKKITMFLYMFLQNGSTMKENYLKTQFCLN